MVEDAVVTEIRRILQTPEIVSHVAAALKQENGNVSETEATAALRDFHALWSELFPAEQARIVQLLIERIDFGIGGMKLRFRDKGLAQMAAEVGIIVGKNRKVAA